MSKKVNVKETATTAMNETIATNTNEGLNLQQLMEKYPLVSLRKLAHATEVTYGILLKKSKEPVVGEAYDPEATNWAALEAVFEKKEINLNTDVDWEALNQGPNRQGATLIKDTSAFKVGDKVYLRRNNEVPYEILYTTETHVVIKLDGTSEPIAWSWNTFMINGPVFEPRAQKSSATNAEVAPATEAEAK